MRVLDLASGTGHLAGAAAARRAIAMGVDLSPAMVELASQLFPQAEFREADAERLPFDDDAFDAITCGFGLHNMLSFENAITEAYRVLRPLEEVTSPPQLAELFGSMIAMDDPRHARLRRITGEPAMLESLFIHGIKRMRCEFTPGGAS